MEEFEKWKAGHEQKLADALNGSKRGFELGLSLGWEGALEWVNKMFYSEDTIDIEGKVITELEDGPEN